MLMYSTPQLTEEGRVAFLNTEYKPVSAQEQYETITLRERRYVSKVISMFGGRRGRWLDVGCAAGVLLTEAQKAGFEPSAFEVHSPYESTLRNNKDWDIRIASSLAEAGFEAKSFDVVSILDTLNYIADPVGVLRLIKNLLKDDGILLCMVPNTSYLLLKNTGLLAYLRWGRWSNMHSSQYLIHFTSASLRSVLREAGFRVVREEAGEPWLAGSALRLAAKRAWFNVATLLQSVGIRLGVRIDVWAVKV